MFTGIVQQLAVVKKIEKRRDLTRIGNNVDLKNEKINIGDSISINGVCLTVTEIKNSLVFFDIIKETYSKSNLRLLKVNDKVNVEFSLKPTDKISGHFVTGHIDCTGKIKSKKKEVDVIYFEISIPKEFNAYLAPKASIAVDGISLTIVDSYNDYFSFYAIPHTINNTTLKHSKVGSPVNIEFDILAKYIHKMTQPQNPSSKISVQYLKEKGYI